MVYLGVQEFKNVKVVPSGQLILSSITFPEYFVKEMKEETVEHAEQDIINFAEIIAKRLNITYRFVGEEPEDVVTNQYNNAMKENLPEYGIEVIEIPRKEVENTVISASKVRACLEQGNIEKLTTMLPKTTLCFLGLSAH